MYILTLASVVLHPTCSSCSLHTFPFLQWQHSMLSNLAPGPWAGCSPLIPLQPPTHSGHWSFYSSLFTWKASFPSDPWTSPLRPGWRLLSSKCLTHVLNKYFLSGYSLGILNWETDKTCFLSWSLHSRGWGGREGKREKRRKWGKERERERGEKEMIISGTQKHYEEDKIRWCDGEWLASESLKTWEDWGG